MTTPVLPKLEKPPSPGAPHRADLPTPVERTLSNGLRVIAFQQKSGPKAFAVPLISAQLLFRGGSAAETDDEAGLASLMSSLLTQGTDTLTAVEFAGAVDAMGARIDASSGYDATVCAVSATTPAFRGAFELFDRVVRRSAFAQAEFDRVRTKAIDDLAFTYSSASSLARLVAQRVAFGGAPYGHPVSGTAESLGSLTRDRVVAFHAAFFRPDNGTLIVGGDCTVDDAFALVEAQFGDWKAPAAPLDVQAPALVPSPRDRVVIVDKPDAGRTALLMGRIAIARNDPDYITGIVTTSVLSGYSGRLNQEVRVKRGLSYGAGAQLMARRDAGLFLGSTLVDHTRVAEATAVMRETIAGLAAAPPADAEMVTRKATVSGGFSRSIETLDGVAGVLGELALYDAPLAELNSYLSRVEAVTAANVQTFAGRYLAPDPFVVLVGDAAKFRAGIEAAHADVTVIPLDKLDLNAPDAVR